MVVIWFTYLYQQHSGKHQQLLYKVALEFDVEFVHCSCALQQQNTQIPCLVTFCTTQHFNLMTSDYEAIYQPCQCKAPLQP